MENRRPANKEPGSAPFYKASLGSPKQKNTPWYQWRARDLKPAVVWGEPYGCPSLPAMLIPDDLQFQEQERWEKESPGLPSKEALAAATKWKGGGWWCYSVETEAGMPAPWAAKSFCFCLFSPHCLQISLASFNGSSIWFLSAPYQEQDFYQWLLHLVMPLSHQGDPKPNVPLQLCEIRPSSPKACINNAESTNADPPSSIKMSRMAVFAHWKTLWHSAFGLSICRMNLVATAVTVEGSRSSEKKTKHLAKASHVWGPNLLLDTKLVVLVVYELVSSAPKIHKVSLKENAWRSFPQICRRCRGIMRKHLD